MQLEYCHFSNPNEITDLGTSVVANISPHKCEVRLDVPAHESTKILCDVVLPNVKLDVPAHESTKILCDVVLPNVKPESGHNSRVTLYRKPNNRGRR